MAFYRCGGGSSGGSGVPLMSRNDWDALTIQEKQAYNLVAVQDTSSGYERGVLYNGADAPIPVVHIYGAYWDGSDHPTSWSRTDEAENFASPNPYYNGISTTPSSPFDNLMPWSGMQIVEDTNAGSLVSIPKFWYKITQNASTHDLKIQIADGATEGFSVSPAHMDRGDGKGERNIIYVGRYHCAPNTYKSTTGVLPQVDVTRANFRTAIHNLGTNIWMMDFATRFTIWLLYLVEFADWDSQYYIGRGCGDGGATGNMGYTDNMPYHTGTTQSSRTTFGLGTQYRYIEGLWDNVFDWIDGCYTDANGLNIILNPSNSSDSSGGILVGTPVYGYPSQFTLENVSGTFPLFIPTVGEGSYSTYSCDYWNYDGSDYPRLCVGGYYSNDPSFGLFCVEDGYDIDISSGSNYIGSRPIKLP